MCVWEREREREMLIGRNDHCQSHRRLIRIYGWSGFRHLRNKQILCSSKLVLSLKPISKFNNMIITWYSIASFNFKNALKESAFIINMQMNFWDFRNFFKDFRILSLNLRSLRYCFRLWDFLGFFGIFSRMIIPPLKQSIYIFLKYC